MDSIPNILLVNKDLVHAQLLLETLEVNGYAATIVPNHEIALEYLEKTKPNLILLDETIASAMDGFELCHYLKTNATTQAIPIIFLTALAETAHKIRGFKLGAVDYISQPMNSEEILARIEVHLEWQKRLKSLETQLMESDQHLNKTIKELQKIQLQLIQSEKLASLGQLIVGVAHEINNPVNFIYGNLTHVDTYIQELLQLLQLYQRHYFDPVPEIQNQETEIDLPFLVEDLPNIIQSVKVGTDRIQNIIACLRNFSRTDEAEIKAVNIHEGIESTLLILKSRLKSKGDRPDITILKNYADLPPVECYPSQLNQVFMNIISNAIDALEDATAPDASGQPQKPQISIQTTLAANDRVIIQIQDNGLGIPEAIQVRLFEPFFTTKPIGKGTGLGLSISHQIVNDRHQGTLCCISAPNQGTTFQVEIPLYQPAPDLNGSMLPREKPQ
jgi:signal transduction histidine kinase